ncbi:MAG TPA: hypothetical protein PLU10_06850 [Chitinophagaceae bacterium]|nr:hypothetical protein [Chitinophagaceae bacterium]
MKLSHFLLPVIFAIIALSTSCEYTSKDKLLANSGVCDTSNVKYSTTISTMMTNYCTNCHGGSSPSGGINLEGYSNMSIYAESSLNAMKNGSMPQGSSKLDDCTINKLDRWILNGSQNN